MMRSSKRLKEKISLTEQSQLLTLFILDTSKQVLWQTVMTQMKCHQGITSGSAMFATIIRDIHNIEVLTDDP